MKEKDKNFGRKRTFIKVPTYPGGKQAFIDFFRQNLKYPDQALANRVEGYVHVSYEVDNLGNIVSVHVKKSLGFGCDEEAVRLIRLLKYEAVRNRGVKMKAEMKARIRFALPESATAKIENTNQVANPLQINYSYNLPVKTKNEPDKQNQTHSYTVTYS